MSEEDEEAWLKPERTIFMEEHGVAIRYGQKLRPPRHEEDYSPLYGRHALVQPPLCMQAFQRLGPVRHALAQRMVAGVLEVHAPWSDMLESEAAASKEEKPRIKPRKVPGRR